MKRAMMEFRVGDRVKIIDSQLNLPEDAKGKICNVLGILNDGEVIQIDVEYTGKPWVTIRKNLLLVEKKS